MKQTNVFCSKCGSKLKVNRFGLSIGVEPCASCLEISLIEGKMIGTEKGFNVGIGRKSPVGDDQIEKQYATKLVGNED